MVETLREAILRVLRGRQMTTLQVKDEVGESIAEVMAELAELRKRGDIYRDEHNAWRVSPWEH